MLLQTSHDSRFQVAEAQVRIFDLTDLRPGVVARALTDGRGYFALPLAALAGSVLPQGFTLGQKDACQPVLASELPEENKKEVLR